MEKDDIFDTLYPIGKERWIKVLIHDRDKAMKDLRWTSGKEVDNRGYTLTAIATRDEYIPQISAIQDLEDTLNSFLIHLLPEYEMNTVHSIFKQKKEELKSKVIFQG